jgi:hypothetical protein
VVPALVALLRVGQHAHVAEADRSTRLARLVVAATLVGLAALAPAAVAGAGPVVASVTAVVLAGSVLAWAQVGRAWAVRGVVTWALLSAAAVGFLGWLAHGMLVSPLSTTELTVGAAAWSLAVLTLLPLQGRLRLWIAGPDARRPTTRSVSGPPFFRRSHWPHWWLPVRGCRGHPGV